MGGFHLVIDAASRDIRKLLQRGKVPSDVAEKIQQKLDRLMALSVLELEHQSEGQNPKSESICASIVNEAVDWVCHVEIPKLQVSAAERENAMLRQKISELRQQIDGHEVEELFLGAKVDRLQDGHRYMMGTLFREVVALNTQVTLLKTKEREAKSEYSSPLGRPASPSSPLSRRETKLSLRSQPGPGGSGTSPDKDLAVAPIGASFDYNQYVQLVDGENIAWPERCQALENQLAQLVEHSNQEKAALVSMHRAAVKEKDSHISKLELELAQLTLQRSNFDTRFADATRQIRQSFKQDLEDLSRQVKKLQLVVKDNFETIANEVALLERSLTFFTRFTHRVVSTVQAQVKRLATGQRVRRAHVAPFWRAFLLQGEDDPEADCKAYWQSHALTKSFAEMCTSTVQNLESLSREIIEQIYSEQAEVLEGRSLTPQASVDQMEKPRTASDGAEVHKIGEREVVKTLQSTVDPGPFRTKLAESSRALLPSPPSTKKGKDPTTLASPPQHSQSPTAAGASLSLPPDATAQRSVKSKPVTVEKSPSHSTKTVGPEARDAKLPPEKVRKKQVQTVVRNVLRRVVLQVKKKLLLRKMSFRSKNLLLELTELDANLKMASEEVQRARHELAEGPTKTLVSPKTAAASAAGYKPTRGRGSPDRSATPQRSATPPVPLVAPKVLVNQEAQTDDPTFMPNPIPSPLSPGSPPSRPGTKGKAGFTSRSSEDQLFRISTIDPSRPRGKGAPTASDGGGTPQGLPTVFVPVPSVASKEHREQSERLLLQRANRMA